jgi:hypothetical protein
VLPGKSDGAQALLPIHFEQQIPAWILAFHLTGAGAREEKADLVDLFVAKVCGRPGAQDTAATEYGCKPGLVCRSEP